MVVLTTFLVKRSLSVSSSDSAGALAVRRADPSPGLRQCGLHCHYVAGLTRDASFTMPFPFKVPSRQLILATSVFASLGCSELPPEPATPSNIIPTDSREAQLDSLVSPIPREPIPCGRVHGLVIDQDAMRVVGDAEVQFVSTSERASASSSSGRYFEAQLADTAVIAVRVIRKGSIPLEAMGFVSPRVDFGHRMILLVSRRGLNWYMQSGFCPGQNGDDRTAPFEPMIHAPRGMGGV